MVHAVAYEERDPKEARRLALLKFLALISLVPDADWPTEGDGWVEIESNGCQPAEAVG